MTKIMLFTALLISTTFPAWAQVRVDSYTRRDGTYVAPHTRSAPDGRYNNNYGTAPNVNPSTGLQGTNQPTWNDRPPPPSNSFGSPSRKY